MLKQFKKFNELSTKEQDKIFSFLDGFWEMAENLEIPASKINKLSILLEEALMGFLPPAEFLDKIIGMFESSPEKGKELKKEIQSKIFFDLKSELAEMYNKEEIGNIGFKEEETKEKLKEPKEKLKKMPEILSNPNDLYIEKIEGETEKISFLKKPPLSEKQKTLGEEIGLKK